MRIAVLSDIHGNLLALDAVMSDIEKQAPDVIWCGGDLGWGGPWASECIARVRSEGWVCVKGNTDVWITGDPQGVTDPEQREQLQLLSAIHDVNADDARWLLQQPLGHSPAGSVLLVHARPDTPFEAPEPDAPAAEFKAYEDQAQVIVYAHIHKAFVRRLANGTIVANTGSVGMPFDGETASYLLIDRIGPDISMRHRRVAFDRRAVIAEAKRQPDPLREFTLEKLQRS